jgi:hypothetical protein
VQVQHQLPIVRTGCSTHELAADDRSTCCKRKTLLAPSSPTQMHQHGDARAGVQGDGAHSQAFRRWGLDLRARDGGFAVSQRPWREPDVPNTTRGWSQTLGQDKPRRTRLSADGWRHPTRLVRLHLAAPKPSSTDVAVLQAAKKYKLSFPDEKVQFKRLVMALFAVRGSSGHGFSHGGNYH